MKSSSLNFHDSASTALIDDYYKTLQDVINCQQAPAVKHRDSDGNRWYKILVKIEQFVVLIMRTHVLGIAQREATGVRFWFGFALDCTVSGKQLIWDRSDLGS